jgi:hypothetical protein
MPQSSAIVGDRAEISFGVWVTSCRSPHPNAHRKLRPLHSFTYYKRFNRPAAGLCKLLGSLVLAVCAAMVDVERSGYHSVGS